MGKERISFLTKEFLTGFPSFCGFEVTRIQFGSMETKLSVRQERLQQACGERNIYPDGCICFRY